MVNSGAKSSFEFSEWLTSTPTARLRVIIIYRPPFSNTHPVTITTFLSEFANYLESVVLSNEQLIICGDFNIHVNVCSDADTIKFMDLLESMSLIQHVVDSTHVHGNTLDLIITRTTDNIMPTPPRVGSLFSDHATVFAHLNATRPQRSTKQIVYRKLKSIDIDRFTNDIGTSLLCQSPPDNLDSLVKCYNSTLSSVLDQHAPLRSRTITLRQRAPWFNDDIKKAKREKRKAERRWRSSKLDSDLQLFKSKRNRMMFLMDNARRNYYSDFISENCHDQAKLFRACKSLLNLQTDNTLPPHTDQSLLGHELGEYFALKISTIKNELDTYSSTSSASSLTSTHRYTGTDFSQFVCLSEGEMRELIISSNKNCCLLDPIPSLLLPAWSDNNF